MRPYPLAPLSVGSAGKIEDRGSEKSEKKKFQNWACLVWKFLMELVRVFCTYLGAPNRHIAKNQTNPKMYSKFWLGLFTPYFPGLEPTNGSPWYLWMTSTGAELLMAMVSKLSQKVADSDTGFFQLEVARIRNPQGALASAACNGKPTRGMFGFFWIFRYILELLDFWPPRKS